MRLFSSLLVAIALFAMPAMADQKSDTEAYVPYTSIKPCDWWSYDSQSGNYVCNFYPSSINIVEARDVQNIVDDLEAKIADLEARIAALEAERK